jgi:Response regulator containing CheY-like receiver, AAA-type ATPase, and DNA-binding domains
MEKILVINNDIDIMSLMKSWLERKSYKVKYTGNEDEILSTVKDFKPDLIIVDVLKEEAAKKLKGAENTKHIPIILMTGYTINKQNLSNEDVDDIIQKPFDPQVLEKKIKTLLKKTG